MRKEKKKQTEEERLKQKEENAKISKEMRGHISSGDFFLLFAAGALVSSLVLRFVLSFYKNNGQYIKVSLWLFIGCILTLIIGLFIKLTRTETVRIIFMILTIVFLIILAVILFVMYPDKLQSDWKSIVYVVSLLLLISCTLTYNLYRVIKKSVSLMFENIPRISKMETKDILTIIIVPIATFITGLLIKKSLVLHK